MVSLVTLHILLRCSRVTMPEWDRDSDLAQHWDSIFSTITLEYITKHTSILLLLPQAQHDEATVAHARYLGPTS